MYPSDLREKHQNGMHRSALTGRNATSSMVPCDASQVASILRNWAMISFAVGVLACVFAVPTPSWASLSIDIPEMNGFTVLTTEDNASIANKTVIVEYRGPIVAPMSTNMRSIWSQISRMERFDTLVLRLDSPGGVDTEGARVIDTLVSIRQKMTLITLVGERDLCASMCIALFIQGQRRYARPTSSWVFHGASPTENGPPDARMTTRHFDIYRLRGIDVEFIDYLHDNDFLSQPGGYWISGSELSRRSNIITQLMANWQPASATKVAHTR